MKKNGKPKDMYLIHLVKSWNKGQFHPISLENEFTHKNKYLISQLKCLSSKSLYILYMKELERIAKENKDITTKKNEKILTKKISYTNQNNKINKIIKGSCNKMLLDLIFNNKNIKKNFLNYDKHKNIYKLKSNFGATISIPSLKYKFEKCKTDNINILSTKNGNKHFKHSLSSLTPTNNQLYLKRIKPIKNSLKLEEKNNFFNSQQFSKDHKQNEYEDTFKGMLTINYNRSINKINNIHKNYSNYNIRKKY